MTEELGRRLRSLLAERKWAQADLVRESGVDKNTLSGLINGRSIPRPATIGRLEDALGVERGTLTAPAEDARPGERAKLAGVSDAELIAELSYRIERLRREVGKAGGDGTGDEGGGSVVAFPSGPTGPAPVQQQAARKGRSKTQAYREQQDAAGEESQDPEG